MAEFNGKKIMLAGLKGEQGPEGPQGPKGEKGEPGGSWTFPSGTLLSIVSAAYDDETFVDGVGFSTATDTDEEGKALYGDVALVTEELIKDTAGATIGAEYSILCNGLIYHAVLHDDDGTYSLDVSNPYLLKDDEAVARAIASVSSARQGITGQYLSQPEGLLEGTSYAMEAELRASENIIDMVEVPETTKNGITYSVTKQADGDFLVKINGTATADTTIPITALSATPVVPAGKYLRAVFFRKNFGTKEAPYDEMAFLYSRNVYGEYSGHCFRTGGARMYESHGWWSSTMKTDAIHGFMLGINSGASFDKQEVRAVMGYPEDANDETMPDVTDASYYEPFGAVSKGSVIQYASKNIMDLKGMQTVYASSKSDRLVNMPGSFGDYGSCHAWQFMLFKAEGLDVDASPFTIKKGHRYLFVIDFADAYGTALTSESFIRNLQVCEYSSGDRKFVVNWAPTEQNTDTGNNRIWALVTAQQDVERALFSPIVVCAGEEANPFYGQRVHASGMATIDLTELGWGATAVLQDVGQFFNSSAEYLEGGSSVQMYTARGPLVKAFKKDLYFTAGGGYRLIVSEFSDEPPALNQSVGWDDLNLISQKVYRTSGPITLDGETNSVILMVESADGSAITAEDLSSWAAASQLEYGFEATEHADYVPPKTIGTFDYSKDGPSKSFAVEVVEGDNVNIGFVPELGQLPIVYASSAEDLTKSVVTWASDDLATQVANIEAELDGKVSKIVPSYTNDDVGIYYTQRSGYTGVIMGAQYPAAGSMARYTSRATVKTSTPTESNDAANKEYVDTALLKKSKNFIGARRLRYDDSTKEYAFGDYIKIRDLNIGELGILVTCGKNKQAKGMPTKSQYGTKYGNTKAFVLASDWWDAKTGRLSVLEFVRALTGITGLTASRLGEFDPYLGAFSTAKRGQWYIASPMTTQDWSDAGTDPWPVAVGRLKHQFDHRKTCSAFRTVTDGQEVWEVRNSRFMVKFVRDFVDTDWSGWTGNMADTWVEVEVARLSINGGSTPLKFLFKVNFRRF